MPIDPSKHSHSSTTEDQGSLSAFDIMFASAKPSPASQDSSRIEITDTPDEILVPKGSTRASALEVPIKFVANFQIALDKLLIDLYEGSEYIDVRETSHGKHIQLRSFEIDTPEALIEAKKLRDSLDIIKQELRGINQTLFPQTVDALNHASPSSEKSVLTGAQGLAAVVTDAVGGVFRQLAYYPSMGGTLGKQAWTYYNGNNRLQNAITQLQATMQRCSSQTTQNEDLKRIQELATEYTEPFKKVFHFLNHHRHHVVSIIGAERVLASTPSQSVSTGATTVRLLNAKFMELRSLYLKQCTSLNDPGLLIQYSEQAQGLENELKSDLEAWPNPDEKAKWIKLLTSYIEAMKNQAHLRTVSETVLLAGRRVMNAAHPNIDFFIQYGKQLQDITDDISKTIPLLLVEDNGFFSALRTLSAALQLPKEEMAALPHTEAKERFSQINKTFEQNRKALLSSTMMQRVESDQLKGLLAIDALTWKAGIAFTPLYPKQFALERASAMAQLQAEVSYRHRALVKEQFTENVLNILRREANELSDEDLKVVIQLERDVLPFIDTKAPLYKLLKEKIIAAYATQRQRAQSTSGIGGYLSSTWQSVKHLTSGVGGRLPTNHAETDGSAEHSQASIDKLVAKYIAQTSRERETLRRLTTLFESEQSQHSEQQDVATASRDDSALLKAHKCLSDAIKQRDDTHFQSRQKQIAELYQKGRTTLQITPLSDLCDLLATEIREGSSEEVEMLKADDNSSDLAKFAIYDSDSDWSIRLKMAHNTLRELDVLLGRYSIGEVSWVDVLWQTWQMKDQLVALAEEFSAICDSIVPWSILSSSKDEHTSRIIHASKDILSMFVPLDPSAEMPSAPDGKDTTSVAHQQAHKQLKKDIDVILVSLPNELVSDGKGGFVVYKQMVVDLLTQIDAILTHDKVLFIAKAGVDLMGNESFQRLQDLMAKIAAIQSNPTIHAVVSKYLGAVRIKLEHELAKMGQYEQAAGLKIGYLTTKVMRAMPSVRAFLEAGHGVLFDEFNVFLEHYSHNQKAQEIAHRLKDIYSELRVSSRSGQQAISPGDLASYQTRLEAERLTIAELKKQHVQMDDVDYWLGLLNQHLPVDPTPPIVSGRQHNLCQRQREMATQQLKVGIEAMIDMEMGRVKEKLSQMAVSMDEIDHNIRMFQSKHTPDVNTYQRATMAEWSALISHRNTTTAEQSAEKAQLTYYETLKAQFASSTPPTALGIAKAQDDLKIRRLYLSDLQTAIQEITNLKWNTFYYHHDCFKDHHDRFDELLSAVLMIQADPLSPDVIQSGFEKLDTLDKALARIPKMAHLRRAVQIASHQVHQHLSKIMPQALARPTLSTYFAQHPFPVEDLSSENCLLDGEQNDIRKNVLRYINQKYREAKPNSNNHAAFQAAEEFIERWDIGKAEQGRRILKAMQHEDSKHGHLPDPKYINDLDDLNLFYKMTAPNGSCLHRYVFSKKTLDTEFSKKKIGWFGLRLRIQHRKTSLKTVAQGLLQKEKSDLASLREGMSAKHKSSNEKIQLLREYAAKHKNKKYMRDKLLTHILLLEKENRPEAIDVLLDNTSVVSVSEEQMLAACDKYNQLAREIGCQPLTEEQRTYLVQKAKMSGDFWWGNHKKGKAELLIQALERGDLESVTLIASTHTNLISRFIGNPTTGRDLFPPVTPHRDVSDSTPETSAQPQETAETPPKSAQNAEGLVTQVSSNHPIDDDGVHKPSAEPSTRNDF